MKEKKLHYFLSGSRIKYLRELAKVSQQDLADKLGVSRQSLVGWEGKNEVKVGSDLLKTLADSLNTSIDDLTNVPRGKTSLDIAIGTIPFYDAVAVGGNSMLADQHSITEPAEMINPGTFFRTAQGALRVYGHSMFPKYPSGCIIAFRNGSESSVIHYGEDYVIEMEDRRIVKRVQKSKIDGHIQVNSYNTMKDDTGTQVYSSYDIPLNAIKRLYTVLGKIELEASI
jgi:transcriptional regulator with XRE-family HTH domain